MHKGIAVSKTNYDRSRKCLSEKLIEAREGAGLTQKQVGVSGIISQTELSKMENGQRRVDFLVLVQLAKLYKKDITFFKPSTK